MNNADNYAIPIERHIRWLRDKISDMDWEGEDTTFLWQEYREMTRRQREGEKYYVLF